MTFHDYGSKLVDRMLTVNEVADLLHVHPSSVRRWQKSGELKSYRLGCKGSLRFKNEDILDFIRVSGQPRFGIGRKRGGRKMRLTAKLTQKDRNAVVENSNCVTSSELEKAAEEMLRVFADKAPIGVYLVQNGKFCYVNRTFCTITGFAEKDLLGCESIELVIPEDRGRVSQNAIKMLKGEITNPYEFRIITRDKTIKWVLESVSSTQFQGGRAFLGSFFDISKSKAAEEARQKSEDKTKALFKGMPFPTCIWRKRGDEFELADFNNAAYLTTEGRIEGFLGDKCSEFFQDRPDLVEDILHCYDSQETIKRETDIFPALNRCRQNCYFHQRFCAA